MKERSKSHNNPLHGRGRTNPEGQNPKANDSEDHDLYHDENRRNMYDPEVADALKGGKKKGQN